MDVYPADFSGETISRCWAAYGGELFVWLQQLCVRLRPGEII